MFSCEAIHIVEKLLSRDQNAVIGGELFKKSVLNTINEGCFTQWQVT